MCGPAENKDDADGDNHQCDSPSHLLDPLYTEKCHQNGMAVKRKRSSYIFTLQLLPFYLVIIGHLSLKRRGAFETMQIVLSVL